MAAGGPAELPRPAAAESRHGRAAGRTALTGAAKVDPFWADAIERADVGAIRDLLARGADVDARDRHGQTGLMRAAHAGHRSVVEVLVAHGADLDVAAKFGLSALMLAIVAGHAEIAELLLRAGADVSLRGSGAPGF